MKRQIILSLAMLSTAFAADPPEAQIREAETLARQGRNEEALAMAEKLATMLEQQVAGGDKPARWGMEAFQLAAKISRNDLLDFERSLAFCARMSAVADSDYWRVPARLETALTYRAMGDFAKAQQEYDAIAASDERQRPAGLLPHAEMICFDLKQKEKGRRLLEAAFMHDGVASHLRMGMIGKCAGRAMDEGRQEEALKWYAMVEKMPFAKPGEKDRHLSRAWFEMGRIEETRGRTTAAKKLYRQALELESGDVRYRVRARDALESIEYFE